MAKCEEILERYSRVSGYIRPIIGWNEGKQAEFNDRLEFDVGKQVGLPTYKTTIKKDEKVLAK